MLNRQIRHETIRCEDENDNRDTEAETLRCVGETDVQRNAENKRCEMYKKRKTYGDIHTKITKGRHIDK